MSAELGFTRLSLTSDELRPFDYLKFDKETIAGVLGWEIMSDDRGDYGGTIKEIKKTRITDNIVPDLDLLADAFNTEILPTIPGFENTELVFDVMELPEMQDDMVELSNYIFGLKDRGGINGDELRMAFRYEPMETPEMQVFTVANDIIPLSEAIDSEFNVDNSQKSFNNNFIETKSVQDYGCFDALFKHRG